MRSFRTISTILFLLLSAGGVLGQTGRVVGILPFHNTGSPKFGWVSQGTEDILSNALSGFNAVSIFEKETQQRVLKQLGIASAGDVNARQAFAIGKQTGVEVIFLGDYAVDAGQLTLNFRVLSTYTGGEIYRETFTGPLDNIFSFMKKGIAAGLDVMQVELSSAERESLTGRPTASMDAWEAYCKAYIEIEKESPLEIIAGYFQRALQTDPGFWQAQYNLGVIYYNFRLYDKALKQFNEVVAKNPDVFKGYYGRGVIHVLEGEYERAIGQFRRSLDLNPKHDRSYYYLGIAYARSDSLKNGLQALEQSIRLNPHYAPAHYQLGLAEMQRGWFKKAITALIEATELNPESYQAHNALGEAYYALNAFEEAIIEFKKAIALKATYATAYFNLGNSIYRRGALAEIVDSFWALLESQYLGEETAGNTEGLYADSPLKGLEELRNRSRIQDNSQVLKEMIGAYRTALRYDERFYEASYNLALTYENLAMADSARYFYQRAIAQKPDLSQAHMRLGKLYEAQERYEEALEQFKTVVTITPDYFVANPRLGEEYRYLNIIERVLNDHIDRLDRNPRDTKALEVVGKIYLSLGRFGQAEQYYEQLVEVSPDHMLAQQKLREIRRRLRKL